MTKISFEGCLCLGNVSLTHRVHLNYFRFMESYWLFIGFKVILHVPIYIFFLLGILQTNSVVAAVEVHLV